MPVTVKDVEHVAELARLEFTAPEKEKLTHQLNKILDYMEKLNNLDTSAVEPLTHVNESTNIMRRDEIEPSLSPDEALKNAPAKTKTFFKVPKVIGGR